MRMIFENHDFTTTRCAEFIDLTDDLEETVERSQIENGMALVYSPHTTCAVVINERESGFIRDFEDLIHRPRAGRARLSTRRHGPANGEPRGRRPRVPERPRALQARAARRRVADRSDHRRPACSSVDGSACSSSSSTGPAIGRSSSRFWGSDGGRGRGADRGRGSLPRRGRELPRRIELLPARASSAPDERLRLRPAGGQPRRRGSAATGRRCSTGSRGEVDAVYAGRAPEHRSCGGWRGRSGDSTFLASRSIA